MGYSEEYRNLTSKVAQTKRLSDNEFAVFKKVIEELCAARGIIPDSYPNTYDQIRNEIFGEEKKPASKFICELRNKYYPTRKRNIKWLERIQSYIPKAESNNSSVNNSKEEIKAIHRRLLDLNNEDDIPTARLEAEEAFNKYKYDCVIIKDVFKFNMRISWWARIRQIIEICNVEQSDELKTIFKLHLAECEIKEAYQNRNEKELYIKKLENAQHHLGEIPISHQTTENYYYWVGRWYLEYWWITQSSGNNSKLKLALNNFSAAQSVAQSNRWWLLTYICISKKLLYKNFDSELELLKNSVNERRKQHPELASAKIYKITSQILDDLNTKSYKLPSVIQSINKPNSVTDFEETSQHHIELIFINEKVQEKKYKKLISNWLSK